MTILLVVISVWIVMDRRNAGGDRENYHDQVFNVVGVMDGDTFDIDLPDDDDAKTRIRLWGVDTPEVAGSPGGPMYYGAQASEFAKSLLSNHKVKLVLSPTKSRDKYGRLLAYVYLPDSQGAMLNEMLLETGHAYADLRFEHPLRQRFETLEKRARSAGAGLWNNLQIGQMPGWRQRMENARNGK